MKYYWIFQFYKLTVQEGVWTDVTEVEVLAYNYSEALVMAQGLIEPERKERLFRVKAILVPDKK